MSEEVSTSSLSRTTGKLRPTHLSKEPYITFNVRTTSPTTVCRYSRGTLEGNRKNVKRRPGWTSADLLLIRYLEKQTVLFARGCSSRNVWAWMRLFLNRDDDWSRWPGCWKWKGGYYDSSREPFYNHMLLKEVFILPTKDKKKHMCMSKLRKINCFHRLCS